MLISTRLELFPIQWGGSVDVAGLLDVAGSSVVLGSGTFNAGSLIFNSVGSVAIAEDSSLLISGPSNAGSGLDLFATADVTLDGAVTVSGDVDIVAGVTAGGIHVNAKLNGTGAILLDAADEITINAGIDPTAVILKANDDITVNASVVAADLISVSAGEDGSGGFTLSLTGSLTTTDVGSDVTVVTGSGSGDVSVDGATTGLDQVVLTSLAGALNGAGLVTGDVVDLNAISGIGNTTGLMLSARNASADTTLGDIAIDNVSADAVSVTSLVTGSGAIAMSPNVVSAEAFLADNIRPVVLPIPLIAFRSTTSPVTKPAPLSAPAKEVNTT